MRKTSGLWTGLPWRGLIHLSADGRPLVQAIGPVVVRLSRVVTPPLEGYIRLQVDELKPRAAKKPAKRTKARRAASPRKASRLKKGRPS